MSEAAKKSYLIDAEQFKHLMQQNDNKTIPTAMKKVANTKMPQKQKYYEYSELYNKYITENALKRRPLEIIEHSYESSPEQQQLQKQQQKHEKKQAIQQYDSLNDSSLSGSPFDSPSGSPFVSPIGAAIIKTLPKSYINKGLLVYDKLKTSKDLTWDDKHVYLKKKQLGDSDIYDFIRLYTSKQKNIRLKGFDSFKSYTDKFVAQKGKGLAWLKYSFE